MASVKKHCFYKKQKNVNLTKIFIQKNVEIILKEMINATFSSITDYQVG